MQRIVNKCQESIVLRPQGHPPLKTRESAHLQCQFFMRQCLSVVMRVLECQSPSQAEIRMETSGSTRVLRRQCKYPHLSSRCIAVHPAEHCLQHP
jgi:hypothetical protein